MKTTKQNLNKIRLLRITAKAFHLKRKECFDNVDDYTICQFYNGCGAEWMPKKTRELLTSFFAIFSACFMIHDFDYTFNTKDTSYYAFSSVNWNMFLNCVTCIRYKYKWWKLISRFYWFTWCVRLYLACQLFGWKAWIADK